MSIYQTLLGLEKIVGNTTIETEDSRGVEYLCLLHSSVCFPGQGHSVQKNPADFGATCHGPQGLIQNDTSWSGSIDLNP